MTSNESAPTERVRPDVRLARRFSLEGRRALVTGGSLGIGRAVARALGEAGADLAIHHAQAVDEAYGQPDAAEALARELDADGRRVALIEADFERPGEARRTVVDAVGALGGDVDVLVSCAAVQHRTAFTAATPEQVAHQVRINFEATVELLQAVLPPMKERGWGRVLTIGSVNQIRPEPELAIYAALKSAQANLVGNLARQYAPFGVTLNNLAPGLVATDRNRWRREDADAWRAIERGANPMGRAGSPEEMAGAALLLCSEAGSFITGADLQATGGGHL
jgi:NAD(P)-dependent dehydrogenase (short-subunit alcohol dehydrogenase family)